MDYRQESNEISRLIAKIVKIFEKKSAIYRDSVHTYRFDLSRLIAVFSAISTTWDDFYPM